MNRSIMRRILPLILLTLFGLAPAADPDRQMFDLLITGGTIIDGTGEDPYRADLLIRDGIIAHVGDHDPDSQFARERIDATGYVITPGFIDTHSHGNPLETPRLNNFLRMGVTTISLGQDGGSPGGDDLSDWMHRVDRTGTGPNVIHFKGHGTLRRLADAPAEPAAGPHLESMKEELDRAMQTGSFGMTTGLEYTPGRFADMDELVALGEIVADHDGLVMSHMRNEDKDRISDSIDELLEQGRLSGADVHISHLKIVLGNDPDQADAILRLLDSARSAGQTITADLYPYTASFTGIGIVFPDWALPPHDYEEVVEDRRDELADYLRERIHARNGPEATLIGTGPWSGMTLAQVADSLARPFEEVLIDEIGPRGASAAYFVMNEDVMRRFLSDPHVMISSDGSPTIRHPRGYGSFARIIEQFVMEEALLTLEEAVRKMSGLPAETLGLKRSDSQLPPRGALKEGYAADLLIFQPEEIRERATFENPHRPAEGFHWVIVNGVPVIEEGRANEVTPGRMLRKSDQSHSGNEYR